MLKTRCALLTFISIKLKVSSDFKNLFQITLFEMHKIIQLIYSMECAMFVYSVSDDTSVSTPAV